MRLKTSSGAALAAAALLATAACVSDSTAENTSDSALSGSGAGEECAIEETVKLGAVFSLTEAAAFAGAYQQEGLELAIEELNASGDITYELILEDDKTSVEDSVAAFEKLIDRDKVSAIIGPTLSNMAFVTYTDSQSAGVPTLGVSTTAEGIPDIGDYIFRASLPEEVALAASIPAAKETLGMQQVAVLHDSADEFTASAYNTISDVLADEGIEVVVDETFETTDTDFSAQLTKILDADVDAVILSALPGATVPLVTQARDLGIEAPIVGGNAFNSPVLVGALGDAAEGLIVGGAWSAAAETTGNAEFIAAYTEKYDRAPDQFAAQAYTAGYLIDQAVRSDCDANREAIKDNLGQILEYDSILGKISLDEGGEVTQEPVVQIIRDGAFTLL
ncbi:ABC transporter substrate-binding protein [Glycomyces sp. TRM65418]|uniref:ABC transporter substrate-binding protein n=1 Tax=Glycomyces sp. TRM65418 TaxID=2867006 RepID=UPI001CE6C9CC|nr:ABC transporter substrate-binding protein [Glycomyces sp. TRM65418]MCC3764843.1 ABC transporter substrate-binding protein [Glycomyces sp. TRM65418]QZD54490.1 ABC transporter substrate-binding protein [Glycomyces sp. TRM65418]